MIGRADAQMGEWVSMKWDGQFVCALGQVDTPGRGPR